MKMLGIKTILPRFIGHDSLNGTAWQDHTSPSSSPAQDTALSRRRHRFKSGRGRHLE